MPEFTFVIMSDSHIDLCASDEYWWNRCLNTQSSRILAAAVEETNKRHPDFVVHCGDLTNDSARENYEEAARILKTLEAPFYHVPGNHDTYKPGSRELAAGLFGLQDGLLYRTTLWKGWRLIFIDFAYWLYTDGSVREDLDWEAYRAGKVLTIGASEQELAWLTSLFEQDNETPALCFIHPMLAFRDQYPFSRMPDGKPPETSTMKFRLKPSAQRLKALLGRHPCIKAVFSGHGHFHDWIVEEDRVFCQTASLIEYPNEMRLVRVSPNRIESEVFGIASGDYPSRSYMEEWGNHWVAGRTVDRMASVAV